MNSNLRHAFKQEIENIKSISTRKTQQEHKISKEAKTQTIIEQDRNEHIRKKTRDKEETYLNAVQERVALNTT